MMSKATNDAKSKLIDAVFLLVVLFLCLVASALDEPTIGATKNHNKVDVPAGNQCELVISSSSLFSEEADRGACELASVAHRYQERT